jgi:hypothetical protein
MRRLMRGVIQRMDDLVNLIISLIGRGSHVTVLARSSSWVACGLGSSGGSVNPPRVVRAIAADGRGPLTWDAYIENRIALRGAAALLHVVSLRVMPNKMPLANGTTDALTHGTPYTLRINGRMVSGAGGAARATALAKPRFAGVTCQTASRFLASGTRGAAIFSDDGYAWTLGSTGWSGRQGPRSIRGRCAISARAVIAASQPRSTGGRLV